MPEYSEERPSLISVALYTAAESAAMVRELKRLQGWKPALVRHTQDAGNYEILTRPEVRSASTMVAPESAKFYREFDSRMNATLKPLIKHHWQLNLPKHSGTHILRYGPGDHYVPHHDTGPGLNDRYFSIVCYLNNDFTGGQTSFPGLNYSVAPESGKAIVFPSTYLHGSEPVTSGEKFVVVSWVKGPTPINWI
jgi:predicted 2-oxoglutarate/Fe(II)-dependent dioxygenase YbiX